MRKIRAFLLLLALGFNLGLGLSRTLLVPMPVRFYAHFFFGGGSTVTEDFLTSSDKKEIKKVCKTASGSGAVSYDYMQNSLTKSYNVYTSLGRFTCQDGVVKDVYDFNYQNVAEGKSLLRCLTKSRYKGAWQNKGKTFGNCLQKHINLGTPYKVYLYLD
jgi:hypothetical protein